ncbi:MFS transporter [Nocardia gamkensis]|uniref:MFS transporter n=2 Tax=Nocardia gamkensis TaxID=352869 RepID=A0A7X6KZJ4_9NOCA|nr:MFS transporter [Nocardia gamkensis]
MATFMLMLDITVVNVALPDIRSDFGASFADLQWVLDAYAIGLAVFLLTSGSLADILGRRRVFMIGLAVFTVASLGCGLAPNVTLLIIARLLQGLAGATLFAIGPALIGHEYQGNDRGKAFGIFGGVAGLAIAFGPMIGGSITDSMSWRAIFLLNVPIGILALAAAAYRMRESRAATPPPVDWPGLVTFSAGLSFLVIAFLRGETDGWTSPLIVSMFVAAAVLILVFGVIERRRGEKAMLDLTLFRNVTFNGTSAVTMICGLVTMSVLFLLISYMQNILGYSAWETGLRFLPLTLALFVAAALAGTLTTQVPQRIIMGASMTLIAVGLTLTVLVDADSEWTALLPAMLVIGVGMGLFNPPRAFLSIAIAAPEKSGMASGVNETFQQVGIAVGIASVGAFFQNRVKDGFAESGVGHTLGDSATDIGGAIAAGGTPGLDSSIPHEMLGDVHTAANTAVVDGLQTVSFAAAAFALVAAVVAFAFIRERDFYATPETEPARASV